MPCPAQHYFHYYFLLITSCKHDRSIRHVPDAYHVGHAFLKTENCKLKTNSLPCQQLRIKNDVLRADADDVAGKEPLLALYAAAV